MDINNRLIVAPIHSFFSSHRNPLPNEIILEGGYVIRSLDHKLLEPAFNFYSQSFSELQKDALKRCKYAIYHEYDDPDNSPELPNEKVNDIHSITQSLRIVKRTRAVASIFHLRNTGQTIGSVDALSYADKPDSEISYIDHDSDMELFTNDNVIEIEKYWRFVKQLYSSHGGEYHRVLNSLIFFEIAHFNRLYKPRLILLVTCLESLFNTTSEQVSYSIRVRCSQFLESDPTARVQLARIIKQIYSLRSSFVHGQSTPTKILHDQDVQKEILMKTEDICRRCIKKIFDENLISIFDNDSALNREFEKLELGAQSMLHSS